MSELGNKTISGLVSEYYKTVPEIAPDKVEQREFGFGNFTNKIAFRHYAFKGEAQFRKYLIDNAPLFVDYSAAYYKYPDARPMDRKGWLGSELRFDLDASDAKFECSKHDKGWLCQERLDSVKSETIKLIEEFLIRDFGFSEKDIEVNFSGNRGYHIHIRKENVMKLDGVSRQEISSYIKASNLSIESLFPGIKLGPSMQFPGPKPTDAGWRGRVARSFINKLNIGPDFFIFLGIEKSLARKMYREKSLIELGIKNGNWGMASIPRKLDFWSSIITHIVDEDSAFIDENVTNDPSHLMRLQGSMHGGTGFAARKLASVHDLEKFDPMKDAIVFKKGELKVTATTKYPLVINGEESGPMKTRPFRCRPALAHTYI